MRKTTLYAIFLAASVLNGCTVKDMVPAVTGTEMSLVRRSESFIPSTRGIVTGTTLTDDDSGDRTLYVTAYIHPQSGSEMNYLVNEPFEKDGTKWKHTPSIYWPVEATMDMLAYSAQQPFGDQHIDWKVPNGAEGMRIAVGDGRTRDDILYGAVWNGTDPGTSGTTITMHHSQAYIEFALALKEGSSATCSVESIILKDTYLCGDLIIDNNAGLPQHRWDFRRYRASDNMVDDPDSVYGTTLTTVETSVSMLIPEQEMKTVTINYAVNGVHKTHDYELPHANWLAGHNYIYKITLTD